MSSSDLTTAFSKVVVLRNPVSTSARQGLRRIAELRRLFGDDRVVVIDTVAGGAMANRRLLRKHAKLLGPHTLLCIVAGDGTVGMVVETLVQDDKLPDIARNTPILPLWGGNANDLAHMLNGSASLARLRHILARGEVVAIHPLACRLQPRGGKPKVRIAACYASFGATAFAAAKLSEPRSRTHPIHRIPGARFLREFIIGFSAVMEAPVFRVKEEEKVKIVYERTFTTGSRFAKVERLPVKLTDETFFLSTLEDKRWVSALPRIFQATQKRLASRFTHDHADFTIEEKTLAQFDGEPAEIPAGTKVSVTMWEQPFYAVSTLLADRSQKR
jgi:diacylglycerol kinase family enzyme